MTSGKGIAFGNSSRRSMVFEPVKISDFIKKTFTTAKSIVV